MRRNTLGIGHGYIIRELPNGLINYIINIFIHTYYTLTQNTNW